MAQVTLTLPSIPKDWHSTVVGLLGAIGVLVQHYTQTGTVTLEQIAIAVFVAVVCYFIPAKPTPKDEAAMVATITGIVDATLGAKLPAVLTQVRTVSGTASSVVDAAVAVTTEAPQDTTTAGA